MWLAWHRAAVAVELYQGQSGESFVLKFIGLIDFSKKLTFYLLKHHRF